MKNGKIECTTDVQTTEESHMRLERCAEQQPGVGTPGYEGSRHKNHQKLYGRFTLPLRA